MTKSPPAFLDSEFKGTNNKWFSKGIFFETAEGDKANCMYTLKDEDHLGFPSLSRLYLNMSDPTEYNFATTYLGGWAHWEYLCSSPWFKPYIARWRRELEVKLKSEALAIVIRESRRDGKNTMAAARYLIERGWEAKEGQGRTRGRPTKDDIKQATHDLLKANESLEDDFERIMGRPN